MVLKFLVNCEILINILFAVYLFTQYSTAMKVALKVNIIIGRLICTELKPDWSNPEFVILFF